MKKYLFQINLSGIMLILIPFVSHSQSTIWSGVVKDADSHQPISYVSIGVKGKPFGTIADSLGNFKLELKQPSLLESDTIIISRIGYTTVKQLAGTIIKDRPEVLLKSSPGKMLDEVTVNSEKGNLKVYGRGYGSMVLNPRAYANYPRVSDISGREQATVLDVDDNISLKELNFLLIKNNYTKVKYRFNIYTVDDDEQPGKLISTEDVIYNNDSSQGWKTVDLEKHNIQLKGYKKLAFGLQLLDAQIAAGDTSKFSFLIPSYPSPFKKSYFREKSESNWIPVKNSYLYFNVSAYKLKKNKK